MQASIENEIPNCPICHRKAVVIHLYDTYDRADYGWTAGCGAARRADGVHGYDWNAKSRPIDFPSVDAPTKQEAIKKWAAWVDDWHERHNTKRAVTADVGYYLDRWMKEKEL